jgi:hypothetical protein
LQPEVEPKITLKAFSTTGYHSFTCLFAWPILNFTLMLQIDRTNLIVYFIIFRFQFCAAQTKNSEENRSRFQCFLVRLLLALSRDQPCILIFIALKAYLPHLDAVFDHC